MLTNQEHLIKILGAVQTGIVIIAADTHEIVDANSAALDMIGAPKEKVLGAECHQFMCPAEKGHCPITDYGYVIDNSSRQLKRANGELIPIIKTVVEIEIKGRKHLLESFIDVTKLKQAEEEQKKNAEKIKLFAYSVSHDLKSPAIGIYGLAKHLRKLYKDILDEKGKTFCEQILKSSEQLLALVDKINVYIATKESPLNLEDVKPKEILQMIKEEFSSQLHDLQIIWSEPEYIPEMRLDKLSIIRVIRNLVDNALKYGGEDLHEIRIGYRETDEFYVFSVHDDGVGLKQGENEDIFGLFKREKTSQGIQGTGLGLAIVKEIAEQHGGRVWVEPGLEKGTTFSLSISKTLSS